MDDKKKEIALNKRLDFLVLLLGITTIPILIMMFTLTVCGVLSNDPEIKIKYTDDINNINQNMELGEALKLLDITDTSKPEILRMMFISNIPGDIDRIQKLYGDADYKVTTIDKLSYYVDIMYDYNNGIETYRCRPGEAWDETIKCRVFKTTPDKLILTSISDNAEIRYGQIIELEPLSIKTDESLNAGDTVEINYNGVLEYIEISGEYYTEQIKLNQINSIKKL